MSGSPADPRRTREVDAFTTLLYDELRRLAARHLRGERSGHTLQTTALVHEAYIKLLDKQPSAFSDRTHFLATASNVMRQVLVDYARARGTQKRGGDSQRRDSVWTATLAGDPISELDQVDLLDVDRALDALASEDRALAQLV